MQAGLVDAQATRHVDRFAGVTHAVEAGDAGGVGLPTLEAGDVEVAVMRAEARAHGAAGEAHGEAHDAALHLAVDLLFQNEVQRGTAVAGMEQFTGEGPP